MMESFLGNRLIEAGIIYHTFAVFYQHDVVQRRVYVLVGEIVKSPFQTSIGEPYTSPNAPGNMMKFTSLLKSVCCAKQESFYLA